ncbi:hypothetical protein SVIO_025620 [Streptomyces violaceusniger]|uniref:Uncharacterized protein n=1 Tax=Streptomyces violaceusniger TaxID=68280 RepID=A0A4D4L1M1_STRVO|nr:hypothetical protein SVIO_025620 [Streptomyces violaceusniger]
MTTEAFPRWGTIAPTAVHGDVEQDARRLAGLVAGGERLLAALPSCPDRAPHDRERAAAIHERARRVRRAFLARHAESVYGLLTDGLTRPVRLPELVYEAAEHFPGLVPTRAQMDAERELVQADKEGREIDQALFCGAVLRSPTAGHHLVETMLRPTPRAIGLLDAFRANGRAELETVHVERRGAAAHVEFRNAGRLNAEDDRLIADLDTAVDLALLDDAVKVGVLRGGTVDHPKYRGGASSAPVST